jgi:hypothetical protein
MVATSLDRAPVLAGGRGSGDRARGWRQVVLATLLALVGLLPSGMGIDTQSAAAQGGC